MRFYNMFLIIGFLCNSPANTNAAYSEIVNIIPEKPLIYNLLVALFKTCDPNVKKIIIFDDIFTSQSFKALTVVQPQISVSLFSDWDALIKIRRYQFGDLKLNAVIIVIDVNNAWQNIKDFFKNWRYNRDCVVYMFPNPLDDCHSYKSILELIMRFYVSEAYYICLMNGQDTRIYTHDPYGDTEPPHWNKISQELLWGKNWTFYYRSFNEDIHHLCLGFNFKRTDPKRTNIVILGIRKNQIHTTSIEIKEKLYDEIIENYINHYLVRKLDFLRKLTKVKFNYYVVETKKGVTIREQAFDYPGIDASILVKVMMGENSRWDTFYPVFYDSFAIISHSRGSMTPIEKIAKFYGVWTVSSLILILSMTSIVIWFATKKMSFAFFDAIRLLINTGIFVPINSRTRKIYFSMIFLYFMIIHATFSGHLAEFLTKVSFRPNIDTIEDLKDPKIRKIYNFGYQFDSSKEFDDLRQKSEIISNSRSCVRMILRPYSVCMAPFLVVDAVRRNEMFSNMTFHISKNRFGLSLLSDFHRPGFPLRDKFNWALMILYEAGLMHHGINYEVGKFQQIAAMKSAQTYFECRAINMDDLHFTFVFLIIGNCSGLICFLIETVFQKIFNKLKQWYRPNLLRIKRF